MMVYLKLSVFLTNFTNFVTELREKRDRFPAPPRFPQKRAAEFIMLQNNKTTVC